jgi:hypothetical protein
VYTYPNIAVPGYQRQVHALDELEQGLSIDTVTHPRVIELYRDKVKERRTLLELVHSAHRAQSPAARGAVAAKRFREFSEGVYGVPERDVFNYVVKKVQEELADAHEMQGVPAYERLVERFRAPVFTTVPHYGPPTEDTARTGDDSAALSATEICRRIRTALDAHGMSHWQVSTSSSARRFTVLPRSRRIRVPHDRILRQRRSERKVTERKLEGLIAHEVLTHALRAERGAKSGLRLLSVGLPGYLLGEEGIATYREQQVTGAIDYQSQDIYFTIGLAYQLDLMYVDVPQLRSMREVFTILHDYLTVRYGVGDRMATKTALNLCRQVFVTGPWQEEYPMVLTKGLVYLRGAIRISRFLEQYPDYEQWFDVGKFDPANAVHREALAELNIISGVMSDAY